METRQNKTASPNVGIRARDPSIGKLPESGVQTRQMSFRANSEEARLLRVAGTLLARSRALEERIVAIEKASQACKCARLVSNSIVDLLEKAKALLYKMRDIPDPKGRELLARSFNEFLNQIDLLVVDGHYDGKNLAGNESIFISTNVDGDKGFSIPGFDMSSKGLQLRPLTGEMISNADILDRLTKAESVASDLTAHSFSYEAIAFLLQSRMKFARGMIDVLEEGSGQINESRAGHHAVTQVLSEICGTIDNDNEAGDGPAPSQPVKHRAAAGAFQKVGARQPV